MARDKPRSLEPMRTAPSSDMALRESNLRLHKKIGWCVCELISRPIKHYIARSNPRKEQTIGHRRSMRGTKDTSPQSVNRAAFPDVQATAPSQKRVKRADYARRLAERKTLDIYSRKMTLHTFCKEEARHLEFEECILSVNHAVAEAYMLANYYVIQELQDRADGATLCPIKQDFYQQCLAKVTANTHLKNPKTPVLVKAAAAFNELRSNRARADTKYLSQGWFQPAALQMATNAKNAVYLKFGRRLREYITAKYDLSRVNAQEAMDRILAMSTEGFTLTFGRLADPAVVELYPKIPRNAEGGVNWSPHLLMPMLYEICAILRNLMQRSSATIW